MNLLDTKAEFRKVNYPSKIADMYDLYFTGTKGAKVYAKFVVRKNIEGKVPAVLMFHGLSGASDDWTDLLVYASQGYVAAFMDVRGQGGLSQDVGGVAGTTNSAPFTRGIEGGTSTIYLCVTYSLIQHYLLKS